MIETADHSIMDDITARINHHAANNKDHSLYAYVLFDFHWHISEFPGYLLNSNGLLKHDIRKTTALTPESTPELLQERREYQTANQCFSNAGSFVVDHRDSDNVRLVLGYGMSMMPQEHAVIELDGKLYDPTWDALKPESREFLPLFYLEREEVMNFLDESMRGQMALYPSPRLWALYENDHKYFKQACIYARSGG